MDLSISQNFFTNTKLLQNLISNSGITNDDIVFDIGAGKGAITQELVKVAKKVYAFEVDANLVPVLRSSIASYENVQIIPNDFLKYTIPQNMRYKVFSNIPFSITSAVITKLLFLSTPPEDCFLMVQKEAALRFMGIGEGTMISLLLRPFVELSIVTTLNKQDFSPVPAVNTVLFRIKKLASPLIQNEDINLYRDFIVYTLMQQKPTLKLRLNKVFTPDQFNRLSRDLNFAKDIEASALKLPQWIGLYKYFRVGVEPKKKSILIGAGTEYVKSLSKPPKPTRSKLFK